MSEQGEARSTSRRSVQRFGFALSLLLVTIGILFNVVMMFGQPSYQYSSAAPLYISTLVLCLAVIVGLLAIVAQE